MIPFEHIPREFSTPEAAANTAKLTALCVYIRSQWIDHSLWTPEVWSVFMQPIQRNSDTEGWHRRLKQRSKKEHLN
jgi:hypothetical protein